MATATWDAFISHASEDKEEFVRPLARAMTQLGASVWYDEFTLMLGDSLTSSIDKGLAQSRYGIVVLSPAFMCKPWPQRELQGLVAREVDGHSKILPVWHNVTSRDVSDFSPPLADKVAVRTGSQAIDDIAQQILSVIRPDAASDRWTLIGSRIKRDRMARQLSQEALVARSNGKFSLVTLRKIEGGRPVSSQTLLNIAESMSVKAGYYISPKANRERAHVSNCPTCGDGELIVIDEVTKAGEGTFTRHYTTQQCAKCKRIFRDEVME